MWGAISMAAFAAAIGFVEIRGISASARGRKRAWHIVCFATLLTAATGAFMAQSLKVPLANPLYGIEMALRMLGL
ncbi:hypothetical protein [Cohnella sp. REN36]|uniref:hypothetical protein n=1 Tax=Cohnella sp. REN36 TaxID=2887347 RepID=UPI001D145080|nr:hypothetical protein [Cohnella sp. REN36]MCC3371570.1 hypothetical protein [Cohnella sp. REN36]